MTEWICDACGSCYMVQALSSLPHWAQKPMASWFFFCKQQAMKLDANCEKFNWGKKKLKIGDGWHYFRRLTQKCICVYLVVLSYCVKMNIFPCFSIGFSYIICKLGANALSVLMAFGFLSSKKKKSSLWFSESFSDVSTTEPFLL